MRIFRTLFIVSAIVSLIACDPADSDAEFLDDALESVAESVHTMIRSGSATLNDWASDTRPPRLS